MMTDSKQGSKSKKKDFHLHLDCIFKFWIGFIIVWSENIMITYHWSDHVNQRQPGKKPTWIFEFSITLLNFQDLFSLFINFNEKIFHNFKFFRIFVDHKIYFTFL